MKVIMAILSLAVVAAPQEPTKTKEATVQWSQEPDGFRGLKFGSSETEAKRSFTLKLCMNMEGGVSESSGRLCITEFTIGDSTITGLLHFDNDKFVYGTFEFDADAFETIRAIIVERYGKAVVNNSPVKNRMNATFTNAELKWHGKLVEATLTKYAGNLDHGKLTIGLISYVNMMIGKREGKKKKAADVL